MSRIFWSWWPGVFVFKNKLTIKCILLYTCLYILPQIILIMFVFVICKIVMKKNIQDVTKHWISCNMAKVNLTLPITQHYCQFRVIDSITFWWFLIEINLPVNVQFKSIKGKKSMISSLIHHVFFTKRMFVFVLVKFHR